MSTVYSINKGIGRPLEFRGLKAQYIGFLGLGLVALLLLFAAGYLCGLSLYVLIPLTGGLGAALFITVFHLSDKYGQYGLLKRNARRSLPVCLRFSSRKVFILLKQSRYDRY